MSATPGSTNPNQERLLDLLEQAGQQCRELELAYGKEPAPSVELLLNLHRTMVLDFAVRATADPDLLKWVKELMRPVMDWAHVEEKRKDRALAERKHNDQYELRKAERGLRDGQAGDAIRPETLTQIEHELKLL
jgi:hypothetical protein